MVSSKPTASGWVRCLLSCRNCPNSGNSPWWFPAKKGSECIEDRGGRETYIMKMYLFTLFDIATHACIISPPNYLLHYFFTKNISIWLFLYI